MSAGHLARQRSSSSGTRPSIRATTPITRNLDLDLEYQFEPCAATSSFFLYSQDSSIICLHHDSLAVERRFERHRDKILLLAVDNVSERGAGRLVASYDAAQIAIVWDLFTGNEVARFTSYDSIRTAAWMKNGNVAFGNSQGSVILFDVSTNEHVSARTIFDPITALAPASDCQTYAIGYLNGSILIVALQPAFTILHTLTTNRAPSPIVTLAWHASSSKQKSDMLATQTADGDLRVWSVAKPATAETPKTIRILKQSDNTESGLNWAAWSKNGRILQYSASETWSWDVRTKHITCEPIPTVEGVTAVANYGPTATLFTKGPNHTVQQYDMNPPALVKNVQYMPMLSPPVPSKTPQQGTSSIPGTAPPMVLGTSDQVGGPVSLDTIQRNTGEMQAIENAQRDRSGMSSPVSFRSRTESISSRSSNPYQYQRTNPSIISSRAPSGTTFSTVSPSMLGRESMFSGASSIFPKTSSMASSGRRSKGSRLRQEVLMSPESTYVDLFPRTRIRLSNISAFQQPQPLDQESMSADDLRRRMLEIVFGWEDDIEPLIRDELAYHSPGSTSAVLLSKWLGEVDSDMMAAMISSGSVSSSDWMLLALSQMGGQGAGLGKMGQAFVQRLLSQGDFHTSATILLGLGDREDAVEVYVSRSFYMEAILLTCLVFPTDWQRQAHLVRRWGEFVVENSQQHLAMRCFTCTGVEPPIPWASPSMQGQSTPSQAPTSISSMLSPPVSPPPSLRPSNSGRMTAKNSALKLITSFGGPDRVPANRFPSLKSDDRTPTNAPGVTPIAESAISASTAAPNGFLRPSSRGSNAPGRVNTPGGFHRQRLPSIGETPIDVVAPVFPRPSELPTPNDSGSDREKENQLKEITQGAAESQENDAEAPLLLSSARYDPGSAIPGKSPITALPEPDLRTATMPNPPQEQFAAFKEKSRARNGSRDRKPDGLHIQMPNQGQIQTTYVTASRLDSSADLGKYSSNSLPFPSGGLSTGRTDPRSDTRSPPLTGASWSTKSPSVSSRSIDQYISSLEEAGYRQRKNKNAVQRRDRSRDSRSSTKERKSRSKPRLRDLSEDRSKHNQRYVRPAKRSPSSPIPMSPEDLNLYRNANQSVESLESQWARSSVSESRHGREPNTPKGANKLRSGSKASDFSSRTVRRRSPDVYLDSQLGSEASYTGKSQTSSRRASPTGFLDPSGRGRSKSKTGGSLVRSPSSPLPMSPQAKYYKDSDDETDPLRLVEANRQRLRSRQRSSSRKPRDRALSSRRDKSPDHRRKEEDHRTRRSDDGESIPQPQSAIEQRVSSSEIFAMGADQSTLVRERMERAAKKELAARELEARRISLARRTDAPPIHPAEIYSSSRPSLGMRSQTDLSNFPTSGTSPVPEQQGQQGFLPVTPPRATFNELQSRAASVGPYGLPATPRAMRHPKYDPKEDHRIPAVPEVPDNVETLAETYYTGQPMVELPRSMSAPIPHQPQHLPEDLPTHPAFHKGLRPTKQGSAFSPLGDIGAHRPRPSTDASSGAHMPVTVSIDQTLHAADSSVQIITVEDPPLLPELQHLAGNNAGALPPPPPPPPPFHNDGSHHSVSSGSGVGTINIAIDDQPSNDAHVIEVPPPPPPPPSHPIQQMQNARSPPPPTRAPSSRRSPPPPTATHKRGRSDNLKNGIKGFTERLRSTSRGRNNPRSPPELNSTPSPYESVPQLYF